MSWYALDLGDALLAEPALAGLRERAQGAFEEAGRPAKWGVFLAHETGDLHCRAQVFFSPAATDLAEALGAVPCRGCPAGADLLAGDSDALKAAPGAAQSSLAPGK